MIKTLRNGAITLAFVAIFFVPSATTHASSIDDMLDQIKDLMSQIEELQKKLSTAKIEVRQIIRDGIEEGMTGDDIEKLQELLATDPAIYPEGKVTGFFGPLTKAAIKRFQLRHELDATGIMNEETRDLLEEYLHEGFGDRIPPGLLRAPGIAKKIQDRYEINCDKHGHGMGLLCKKLKERHHGDDEDDDDDDSSDDDSDDDDNDEDYDIEVEIEDGTTTVRFTLDDKDEEVEVKSTIYLTVIDAIADELDVDVWDLDTDFKREIRNELQDAREEADDEEDYEVEVEIEDGDTLVSFEIDNDDYDVVIEDSTDEDDVLEEVADELDVDVEDLDEDLKNEILDELEDALDDE